MRGKIKYFFWSTISSACLLIYTSMSGKTQTQIKTAMKAMKAGAVQHLPDGLRDRVSTTVIDTSTPQHIAELQEAGIEPERVSASLNEYVKDDGNYVLIEGKYYKARADNTYDVNGRRVFYVNNRRYGQKEVDEASADSSSTEPGSQDDSVVKRVAPEDEKILASPQEMMQKLQKAQKEMQERNEYLKELEKEK